jgi:hypothetical protein
MAVVRLWLPIFVQPFHDAPVGANLCRRQSRALRSQFLPKILINAEKLGRVDASAKEVTHLLLKHCGPHANASLRTIGHQKMIFGRVCGGDHEPLVHWLLSQDVGIKPRGASQNGIGPLKKLPIAGEKVVVIEMLA